MAAAAQLSTVDVAAGDVVVAATDGVWDNVFPEELAGVVDAAQRRGDAPAAAASVVAQLALSRRAWAVLHPCANPVAQGHTGCGAPAAAEALGRVSGRDVSAKPCSMSVCSSTAML